LGRGFPIFLGVASLIALIFLVIMMVAAVQYEESQGNEATQGQQ
jgi:hypothetical protein